MKAGGWSGATSLKDCYEQSDAATVLDVMEAYG